MNKKRSFKFISPYACGTSGCCAVTTPKHQNPTLITADVFTPSEVSQGVSVTNLLESNIQSKIENSKQKLSTLQESSVTGTSMFKLLNSFNLIPADRLLNFQ